MKFSTRASIKLRLLLPSFYFRSQFSEFLLDHIKPYLYFDRWHIQPFNGQALRMATISQIARVFMPTVGIETGTYMGSSTPYLASMVSKKMYTIEIDQRISKLASERFQKNHPKSKIILLTGDSVVEITKILSTLDSRSERVLAYLDAHWYDNVPTTQEIQALINWGGPWIAVIDDFKVPFDPGYKFDVYGELEIGINILPMSAEINLFVPNSPSETETGRRKGTGYVCMNSEVASLENLMELKRVEI